MNKQGNSMFFSSNTSLIKSRDPSQEKAALKPSPAKRVPVLDLEVNAKSKKMEILQSYYNASCQNSFKKSKSKPNTARSLHNHTTAPIFQRLTPVRLNRDIGKAMDINKVSVNIEAANNQLQMFGNKKTSVSKNSNGHNYDKDYPKTLSKVAPKSSKKNETSAEVSRVEVFEKETIVEQKKHPLVEKEIQIYNVQKEEIIMDNDDVVVNYEDMIVNGLDDMGAMEDEYDISKGEEDVTDEETDTSNKIVMKATTGGKKEPVNGRLGHTTRF